MKGSHALALDLGSSGLRASIHPVERPWEAAAVARRVYRVHRPQGADSLAARFAEADLTERVHGAIAEALAQPGARGLQVAAVGIAAQRGGTAFLDADGRALYLAPNTDLRALFEGAAMEEAHGERLYATTGRAPAFLFVPAKLAWWRNHHPRLSKRIARVTTLGGWAAYLLTGEMGAGPAELAEAGLLDVSAGEIPASLLNDLGVDSGLPPPIVEEGAPIGAVAAGAAAKTGLPRGAPVYLAGPDTGAAMLGMGAAQLNDIGIAAGWSAPVRMIAPAPVFDAQRRTWTGPSLSPGRAYVEASAGDTGGTLEMVRRMLGARAGGDRLDRLVSQSRAGSNMIAAFWGPHAMNLSGPGVTMGGLLAPVPITYNPVRAAYVARATFENVAYAMRECIELAQSVTGAEPRSIALGGGMAASALFPQMLADVLNAPVRRHSPLATATGAAIAASRPADEWASAAREIARRGETAEPDVRGVLAYGESFARWRRLRARLQEMADEL
ncbi:MAG: FGGY-family carbohydrate kinase [Dehalococcoidia bacterium]|nr:FGGY-family carbohydrate kinase [Dehalococcoidia bacterium]